MDVLLKSIRYFNAKRIQLPEKGPERELIAKHFPSTATVNEAADIIYMDIFKKTTIDAILDKKNSIGNDCLLLIDNIHADKEKNSLWNALKKNGRVTVTIDMFYCGAVFFRKEQAKEHFKIRI